MLQLLTGRLYFHFERRGRDFYARAFRATLRVGWPIDQTGGSVIFSSTKAA